MFFTTKVMFQMSYFDIQHPKDIFYNDLKTKTQILTLKRLELKNVLNKKKKKILEKKE